MRAIAIEDEHDRSAKQAEICAAADQVEAAVIEQAALDKNQALQLLGATYSANAYAFSQKYQNCNQWVAELLAVQGAVPRPGTSEEYAALVRFETQRWAEVIRRSGAKIE